MNNPTILIVDDDDVFRLILRADLEQAGFQVLEARTDGEARGLAGEDIDMALVDVRLPDGNGLDLLSHLKVCRPATPVITMTSFTTDHIRSSARSRGAYAHLSKPFRLERLETLVRSALKETNGGA